MGHGHAQAALQSCALSLCSLAWRASSSVALVAPGAVQVDRNVVQPARLAQLPQRMDQGLRPAHGEGGMTTVPPRSTVYAR